MRLRRKWKPDARVSYLLDVGGGVFAQSTMPAGVALEIVRNAGRLETVEVLGATYLCADGRRLVPAEVVDLEGRRVAPRRG